MELTVAPHPSAKCCQARRCCPVAASRPKRCHARRCWPVAASQPKRCHARRCWPVATSRPKHCHTRQCFPVVISSATQLYQMHTRVPLIRWGVVRRWVWPLCPWSLSSCTCMCTPSQGSPRAPWKKKEKSSLSSVFWSRLNGHSDLSHASCLSAWVLPSLASADQGLAALRWVVPCFLARLFSSTYHPWSQKTHPCHLFKAIFLFSTMGKKTEQHSRFWSLQEVYIFREQFCHRCLKFFMLVALK